LLGHIAIRRRDFATARVVLKTAAAAGSTSYLVYHNLAVARVPELAQPWRPDRTIDAQLLDQAAADFRKAIQLSPSHVASYEALAGVIRGTATFVPGDIDLLGRGLVQSPGNTMIEAGLAAAELRAGRVSEGRARLERLCARHPHATTAGMSYARRLLQNETLQAEIEEINRLTAGSQFEEVITMVDRVLARDLEPSARDLMTKTRRRMNDYKTVRSAIELVNRGELEAAKQTLEVVVADDPDPVVMKEAQRVLQEVANQMERRRGGR
jgi:predicted Zn-dependent protease